MADLYCTHDRISDSCEDCAHVRALENGTFRDRLDLHHRGEGLAPTLGRVHRVPAVVAAHNVVIPDQDSDINRGTFIAKGAPIPARLVDRVKAGNKAKR